MMSKPASVTSHPQESALDQTPEAAKIPLKSTGLDIASQMQSVQQAEPGLTFAVDDYSTSVAQALGVIEAIEATLQQKRKQIEDIQIRQEALAREYRQLGQSLDTATKDLAEEFFDIIADLEANRPIADPPAETASEASATPVPAPTGSAPKADEPTSEPPAAKTSGASEILIAAARATVPEKESEASEAPGAPGANEASTLFQAKTAPETESEAVSETASEPAPETGEASDLTLDLSDLPPVPEFLGGRQDSSDQKDDSSSGDANSRPWWKHGKKG